MKHLVHILAQGLLAILRDIHPVERLASKIKVIADLVLTQLADSNLVVETRDSLYLLLTVESSGSNPFFQFCTL